MKLQGKGVSAGIAVGKILFMGRSELDVSKRPAEGIENEIQRFEIARASAAIQLGQLSVETAQSLGRQNSLLFEIHQMMLEDLDYRESVHRIIRNEQACAEWAVSQTILQFSQMFSDMDDEYMRARALDVEDVSRRIIAILSGKQHHLELGDEPVILASEDFTPSETAQFDQNKVLALITSNGSVNSHTAIFARTMGIPAIIGLGKGMHPHLTGQIAALDGGSGEIYINPDKDTLQKIEYEQTRQQEQSKRLEQYRGKPTRTKSGRQIRLYANIGTVSDVTAVLAGDAEGIGLFRTEYLYLESSDYPTEQAQYNAYRVVLKEMGNKQVIIRTLDIGADKRISYFGLPDEENPAMGMRAIRICLARPDMFKTQLRAIYRASVHGNAAIMFPMITSVEEVRRAKELSAQVRDELAKEDIHFNGKIPIGIMIETPASVIISDLLAKEVDFFSIGTNDLTQYTLAADRQNDNVAEFYNTHHEAILRQIRCTVENAHKNGIWVGICGELGADHSMTEALFEIGIDEISVAPSEILGLRSKIAGIE